MKKDRNTGSLRKGAVAGKMSYSYCFFISAVYAVIGLTKGENNAKANNMGGDCRIYNMVYFRLSYSWNITQINLSGHCKFVAT